MARTSSNVVLFLPELLENQRPLLVPLELLSLAPPLLSAGFSVRIIDERLEPLPIAWNGDVHLCCEVWHGEKLLGNAFEEPLDRVRSRIAGCG